VNILPHCPSLYYRRIDFSKTATEWQNFDIPTPCRTWRGYSDKKYKNAQLKALTPGYKGSRKLSIQKIIVAHRDFLPLIGVKYGVERLCGNPLCVEETHLEPLLTEAAQRMVSEYRKEVLQNSEMDKYYTKPEVALRCYKSMKEFLVWHKVDMENVIFVEPSAGSGVFLDIIEEPSIGFDLVPAAPDIHKMDFLCGNTSPFLLQAGKKRRFTIGNPPFGRKAILAIGFLNKTLRCTEAVGFILPIQFRKWSAQSKVLEGAKLLVDTDLPEHSFEFMGKDYGVRCCFQIWVSSKWKTSLPNLRIEEKPATTHTDFEMWQYNCTEGAKKFFDKVEYEWDFAVPRQGFVDYNLKIYSPEECDPKQQWIFFKAKNKKARSNLEQIDFVKLSLKNIGIPGFGKADVVKEYTFLFYHLEP
jgi:hypothetical protein